MYNPVAAVSTSYDVTGRRIGLEISPTARSFVGIPVVDDQIATVADLTTIFAYCSAGRLAVCPLNADGVGIERRAGSDVPE